MIYHGVLGAFVPDFWSFLKRLSGGARGTSGSAFERRGVSARGKRRAKKSDNMAPYTESAQQPLEIF
jgi:hypothetical protein